MAGLPLERVRERIDTLAFENSGRRRSHTLVGSSGSTGSRNPDLVKQFEAAEQIIEQKQSDLHVAIELGQVLLQRIQDADEEKTVLLERLAASDQEMQKFQSVKKNLEVELATLKTVLFCWSIWFDSVLGSDSNRLSSGGGRFS
jgi:hypothetical protein